MNEVCDEEINKPERVASKLADISSGEHLRLVSFIIDASTSTMFYIVLTVFFGGDVNSRQRYF